MGQDHFGLSRLNGLGFILQVAILLLKKLFFSIVLLLHLINLLVSLELDRIIVLLQALPLLNESVKLLLESTLFSHHTLGADLKLLLKVLIFPLQLIDGRLKPIATVLGILLDLVQFLLVFDFQLSNNRIMIVLMLHLGVFAVTLELVHSLLEKSLLILIILLVLLFLLFQEVELASPKSLILLELSLNVGVHPLDLEILDLPLLDLFPDAEFTLGEGLVDLLVLFGKLLIVELQVLDELSLLLLEVLMLLQLNSVFSLVLRLDLLDLFLQVLKSFSLLLILLLNIVLLLLDSGNAFLKDLGGIILLTLKSFLIPFNSLLHLIIVLINSLLLERNLLVLKCLLPLEVDLALGQLVHSSVILHLEVLNLLDKTRLLIL